jgi:hypothetical protein
MTDTTDADRQDRPADPANAAPEADPLMGAPTTQQANHAAMQGSGMGEREIGAQRDPNSDYGEREHAAPDASGDDPVTRGDGEIGEGEGEDGEGV